MQPPGSLCDSGASYECSLSGNPTFLDFVLRSSGLLPLPVAPSVCRDHSLTTSSFLVLPRHRGHSARQGRRTPVTGLICPAPPPAAGLRRRSSSPASRDSGSLADRDFPPA